MKTNIFLCSLWILVTACNAPSTTSSSPPPEPVVRQTPSPLPSPVLPPSPPASLAFAISAEGIGDARLGMTLGELKKQLGSTAEFTVMSDFMVDFQAIAITQDNEVQYYLLYPAGTTATDKDSIDLVLTDNPKYRTAEGVGSGTLLKQAEALYGEATLFFNYASEGREYAKFANQPARGLFFRTKTVDGSQFAGVYPQPEGEYNETADFQENAAIGSVMVRRLPN